MQYSIVKDGVITNVVKADDDTYGLTVFPDNIVLRGAYPLGYRLEGLKLSPDTQVSLVAEDFLLTEKFKRDSGLSNAPVKTFSNIVVTDGAANPVITSGTKYYAGVGFIPVVELTLSDTSINIPLVKIPFVKYADDKPTTTELYLTGSIVDGVLTCSGEAVISGNYKVTAARTNRALDRLAGGVAPFHVQFDDLDFLV